MNDEGQRDREQGTENRGQETTAPELPAPKRSGVDRPGQASRVARPSCATRDAALSTSHSELGTPLILFDIDGTLLMAGDRDHGTAFTHAFEAVYGRPVSLDGVPLAGMLDAQIARHLFEHHGLDQDESDQRLHEMMEAMGERYALAVAERSLRERLLPGVTEAVLACHHHGWATGVLTGNGRAVAHAKLKAAGLDMLLDFGAFGDSAYERGHLVEAAIQEAERATGVRHNPSETVLVGDTPADINAARVAGARVLAVATGRFDVDALQQHHPDAVLPNLSDTDAFVKTIRKMLRAVL